MATATKPRTEKTTDGKQLVEMSWDPITRIVGSLGIYTKIDFANKRVAECYSTSSIFRGERPHPAGAGVVAAASGLAQRDRRVGGRRGRSDPVAVRRELWLRLLRRRDTAIHRGGDHVCGAGRNRNRDRRVGGTGRGGAFRPSGRVNEQGGSVVDHLDKDHHSKKSELPAHSPGAPQGEELVRRKGREAGRSAKAPHRTARDSTSIRPSAHGPIDPRMPHMPPA